MQCLRGDSLILIGVDIRTHAADSIQQSVYLPSSVHSYCQFPPCVVVIQCRYEDLCCISVSDGRALWVVLTLDAFNEFIAPIEVLCDSLESLSSMPHLKSSQRSGARQRRLAIYVAGSKEQLPIHDGARFKVGFWMCDIGPARASREVGACSEQGRGEMVCGNGKDCM